MHHITTHSLSSISLAEADQKLEIPINTSNQKDFDDQFFNGSKYWLLPS